ncbi:choloylglycine hydrolase family protein [Barnesiella sp. ET7]|uniref:choloylglycine hydrolase family protein n=1 Tax=Barnesiella sp. ET7 TaxID=2972460 RepID=UPI0021ACC9D6|nr:choloylglycine hydrolase family protein [Barnesiella sp. ET7]MCR8912534.1 choloylglycine hydrolase family protein [Barnesiella sp. ET7]
MKRLFSLLIAAAAIATPRLWACTGITLTVKDGSKIVARTIEWGGSDLNSQYVIVPRGYEQRSYVPGGQQTGMKFTAKYGYVGLAVEQKEFVAEGLNEAGLSAGLFYFPNYGQYEAYNPAQQASSMADLQLVAWILGNFATVDEAIEGLKTVHVVSIDPRASTVHWRMTDVTGRQVVLEIIAGKMQFYENKLGVLTNSPGFDWQMTNLNNYINLYPGTTEPKSFGDIKLSSFGAGSGFLGLPGDITPPSRFVRAVFYQTTAPQSQSAIEAVTESFHILNNFDIPIGAEFTTGQTPTDIPSATQWTSAADMANRLLYYRTMYNSAIRCFDLKSIDFGRVKYQVQPLDTVKQQPIQTIRIK